MSADYNHTNDPDATFFAPARRAPSQELDALATALRDSHLLRMLLDIIPGPAFVLNLQRQIVAANQATTLLAGHPPGGTVIGMRPGEAMGCLVPTHAPNGCGTGPQCEFCGLLSTILDSAGVSRRVTGTCRIARKDNSALEFDVVAYAAQWDGRTVFLVGLSDSSAARRKEALERTCLRDLATIAGGIQSLMALMSAEYSPRQAALRDAAMNLGEALLDEVRAHRLLIAAEQGSLMVNPAHLDVRELLQECIAVHHGRDAAGGKILRLGEVLAPRMVSDAVLIRRILGNLITNALEAVEEGETVTVGSRRRDDTVELWVHNPGIMSKAVRMQVFQRSFSTKGAGRGIGAYSVRLFTERYLHGSVSFTSDEIDGTTFSVVLPSLPLADDAPADKPRFEAEEEPRKPANAEQAATQPRILLAEDNLLSRTIMLMHLSRLDCRQVCATINGAQALEAFRAHPYDLVLLDLMMPVMDGFMAAREMRQVEASTQRLRTPIIALSASTDEASRAACMAAGIDDVLEKPCEIDTLKRLIETWRR